KREDYLSPSRSGSHAASRSADANLPGLERQAFGSLAALFRQDGTGGKRLNITLWSDRREPRIFSSFLERVFAMNKTPAFFDPPPHGLTVAEVYRNLPPSSLYEHAIRFEKDASIAENGALVAYSGVKTGRSPKDKRVVVRPESKNDIWWG